MPDSIAIPCVKPQKTVDLLPYKVVCPSAMVWAGDRFVIVDEYSHKLLVFSKDFRLIKSIGERGKGTDQFCYPTDICMDDEGAFWITDRWNHRVKRIMEDGRTVFMFGEYGEDPGQFSEPWGIEFWNGRLFVADRNNHRIQVFDKSGTLITSFGISGPDISYYESAEFKKGFVFESWCRKSHRFATPETFFHKENYQFGSLEFPLNFDVLPDGNLLVIDSGNNCIRLFTHDGELLKTYQSTFDNDFLADVAWLNESVWFVTAEHGKSVHVLDNNATVTAHLGVAEGTLNFPYAVNETEIWVLDSWYQKLHIFSWR